ASPAPRTDRYGDPLPAGALMRLGTLRHRIPHWPGRYLFLPDGRTLLIYSDSTVVWQAVDTGRELARWQLPAGLKVGGVAPDGKRLLASDAETFQLWDVPARRRLQTFRGKEKYEQTEG